MILYQESYDVTKNQRLLVILAAIFGSFIFYKILNLPYFIISVILLAFIVIVVVSLGRGNLAVADKTLTITDQQGTFTLNGTQITEIGLETPPTGPAAPANVSKPNLYFRPFAVLALLIKGPKVKVAYRDNQGETKTVIIPTTNTTGLMRALEDIRKSW